MLWLVRTRRKRQGWMQGARYDMCGWGWLLVAMEYVQWTMIVGDGWWVVDSG